MAHEQAVQKQGVSGAPQADHDEEAGDKQQAEGRSQAFAQGDAAHAAADEDWEGPSRTPKTTVLKGTFGTYKVTNGFHFEDGHWSYLCEITMEPNAKAKADQIGWIQVARRTDQATGGWSKGAKDSGMDAERAKRTDQKSGFRVDRRSAPEEKSPFYGMQKGNDGKVAPQKDKKTKIGKHGGEHPYLWDRPRLNPSDGLEFVSTATDLASGTQYDAITWGCQFDMANKSAHADDPKIIEAGDYRVAGRDAAINTWNTGVANGEIDKVPTTFDSAGTAKSLANAVLTRDVGGLQKTLAGVTLDHKKQLVASYRLETGRELPKDLHDQFQPKELHGLEAWLR